MESPRRSRPRAGAAARGEEPTQEQGSGGSCRPGGTRAGAVCSWGMGPWCGAVWEQVLESCCLWAAPAGSVQKAGIPWEGPRGEQGQRGTVREQWR